MLNDEFHNITLSGAIEILVFTLPFCNLIGCSMLLQLAKGFGLVTPDPFSSHELGMVWAQGYAR